MAAQRLLEGHVLDVTPGQWCPACALPSAIVVRTAIADSRTLRIMARVGQFRCTECGVAMPVRV